MSPPPPSRCGLYASPAGAPAAPASPLPTCGGGVGEACVGLYAAQPHETALVFYSAEMWHQDTHASGQLSNQL